MSDKQAILRVFSDAFNTYPHLSEACEAGALAVAEHVRKERREVLMFEIKTLRKNLEKQDEEIERLRGGWDKTAHEQERLRTLIACAVQKLEFVRDNFGTISHAMIEAIDDLREALNPTEESEPEPVEIDPLVKGCVNQTCKAPPGKLRWERLRGTNGLRCTSCSTWWHMPEPEPKTAEMLKALEQRVKALEGQVLKPVNCNVPDGERRYAWDVITSD